MKEEYVPFTCGDDCEDVQDTVESDHDAQLSEDDNSLEKLFDNSPRKYAESPQIILNCKKTLGNWGIYNEAFRDDIIGDILLKIVEKCPEGYKVDKLRAFVNKMMKNHLIDLARKRNAQIRKHDEVSIDAAGVDTLQTVFGSAKRAESNFELNEWLKTLDQEDWKIMVIWEECELENDLRVVKMVNALGIKKGYTVYKFKKWKARMKEKASWYIKFKN